MSRPLEILLYEGEQWGDIASKIQQCAPEVTQALGELHASMLQMGFFRMNRNEDKGLRFVGRFQQVLAEQTFVFWALPKYLKHTDATSDAMPLVLSVIAKTGHLHTFVDKAIFKETQLRSSEKKIDLPQLARWLLQDYSSNGLFFMKEKKTSSKKGRINWSRTISKRVPFLDGDDIFYESPIRTYIDRNDKLLLSEIHKCVIQEAYSSLSAFQKNLYVTPPECDETMLGKLEQYAPVIQKFQRLVFSNRDITLLRALDAWCREQSRYYELPIGTVSFELVWEDCLRGVFGNISKEFTFGTPEYRLGRQENGEYGKYQLDNDAIPDIIHIFKQEDEIRFLLLDAKYYLGQVSTDGHTKAALRPGYQWIKQFPGYKDIAKQVDYRRTLKSKYGLETGKNAFVLPWYEIPGLSLSHSLSPYPWVRYLGMANKGEVDEEHDEICCLLKELGYSKSQDLNPSVSDDNVMVVQIKPDWLYKEFLTHQDRSHVTSVLWDALESFEKE